MELIYGYLTDSCGRCIHYHTPLDIVALKCAQCQKYYACYQCHDALEAHPFEPTAKSEQAPVLCGNCKQLLSRPQYKRGHCPYCVADFNPRCQLHFDIYFKA